MLGRLPSAIAASSAAAATGSSAWKMPLAAIKHRGARVDGSPGVVHLDAAVDLERRRTSPAGRSGRGSPRSEGRPRDSSVCPLHPGRMLMSITSSTWSSTGKTASTGVSMLRVRPTLRPAARAFAIAGPGSPTASWWNDTMSSPASASSSKNCLGSVHHEVAVQGAIVCTGRNESTTTVPSAIGGTKCPSMMSMWMTSACCSTSLTCSAKRARSAERIDAASLPTRPMVLGGLGLPGEGGDEHPIAPVPMGPQSNPGRSAVRAVDLAGAPGRPDGGRWHRPPRRFRLAGTCTPSRRAGLLAPADR